jgi:hypothetical protein
MIQLLPNELFRPGDVSFLIGSRAFATAIRAALGPEHCVVTKYTLRHGLAGARGALAAEPGLHVLAWSPDYPSRWPGVEQVLRATKPNIAKVIELIRDGRVNRDPGLQVRLVKGEIAVERTP